MKRLANLLLAVGAIIAIIAFNFDVTGGGRFVIMDLMAQRQNLLIVGCVAFLAGIVLLVGVQRKGETKDSERDKQPKVATIPPQPKIQIDPSVLLKALLRGASPAEFVGKLIGGIAAAIVGALVVCKIVGFLYEVDPISKAVHLSVWMHPEIFYVPAAILIFLASMKGSHQAIIGMFYLELAACVICILISLAIFRIQWGVLGYFAVEIVCSIAGIAVATKVKPSAASLVQ